MTNNRKLFLTSFGSEFAFTIALFSLAPLILWIFGAEAIGVYGKFQAAVAVCAVFATLRLELTVGRTPLAYRRVLALTSCAGPVLTLVSATVINLLLPEHDVPFSVDIPLTIMMAVAAWLLGFVNVFNFHFVATASKKFLILSKLARISCLVALQLPVAYLLSINSYLYLVFSFVLSLLAFNLVACRAVEVSAPTVASIRTSWRWLIRHRVLVATNVPAALIISIQELLLISVISTYSTYLAGVYFVADRLLKTPTTMLNQTLRQFILTGRIADAARLSRIILGGTMIVTLSSMILATVIADFGASFIKKEFIDVIQYCALLTIFYGASSFVSILISALIKRGSNSYVLFYSIGLLMMTIISSMITKTSELNLLDVFVTLSTTYCLVFGIYLYIRKMGKVAS